MTLFKHKGHEDHEGKPRKFKTSFFSLCAWCTSCLSSFFSRENWLALLLCLILIALTIFTADTTPTWIYQGF